MNEIEVQEPKEELISPEGLEVAQAYLTCRDIGETARVLGLPAHVVSNELSSREVRRYVDNVFMDVGYRNKYKLGNALDTIIDMKMEEIDESEIGSSKDISELLTLAHKFRMDELNLEIKREQLHVSATKIEAGTVNNVQINDTGGTNYNNLLATLMAVKSS